VYLYIDAKIGEKGVYTGFFFISLASGLSFFALKANRGLPYFKAVLESLIAFQAYNKYLNQQLTIKIPSHFQKLLIRYG